MQNWPAWGKPAMHICLFLRSSTHLAPQVSNNDDPKPIIAQKATIFHILWGPGRHFPEYIPPPRALNQNSYHASARATAYKFSPQKCMYRNLFGQMGSRVYWPDLNLPKPSFCRFPKKLSTRVFHRTLQKR